MDTTTLPAAAPGGRTLLTHLGVIQLAGPDAASFIHGQLTQDFALLKMDQARLCALCSPKGRMLASFIGFQRANGDILLVCSRDLLAQTLKRLSMFVLRAKVKLSDETAQFALWGLTGSATKNIAGGACSAWSRADFDQATVVQLYPAGATPRQVWVAPATLPAPDAPEMELADWQRLDVQSGIATVSLPVVEAFVPQMLNYESVGGVSFKKGCYPGQEVVARSQFRGTLKRRAYVMQCDAPCAAGDEVYAPGEEQAVGSVVQSAGRPDGGSVAIVSAQIAALAAGALHLKNPAGPVFTQLPLPYPLLEDI